MVLDGNALNVDGDLKQIATKYLNREISLRDLEDCVASGFSYLAALPKCAERDLYGTIELGLAEMSIGHRNEDEFRDLVSDSEYLGVL